MGYKVGRDMGILSYTKAESLLGSRHELTIGNNTKLVRRDNGIAVRHWVTDIITYHPDGSISLQAYDAVSTKARYNAYLKQQVWSKQGQMYIKDSYGNEYKFDDDIAIGSDGSINIFPYFSKELGKFIGKEIPTEDVLKQTVATFTIDEMLNIWNEFKNYRYFLAKYCKITFLPLTISEKGDYDESWRNGVSERLRA